MIVTSFLAVPVLLIAAFIIPVAGSFNRSYSRYVALTASVFALVASLATINPVLDNGVITDVMGDWTAPYGISITVDLFSLFVIITTSFLGLLSILYSITEIKSSRAEYYTLICLLLAGLLGMSHTGDLFNMFIFLEITSISSYALTAYNTDSKSILASIKYLIMGSFATSLVLLGIALTYGLTGTLNMADIAVSIRSFDPHATSLMLAMIISGFAFKSAIVPLHTWKPDTLDAAPLPASTLFASASTMVSIYALIRITSTIFAAPHPYVMLIAGTLTMLVGTFMAVQQKNIIKLLAYSAISQIGFILIAFATSQSAGIYHMFNVAIIEALLFITAGTVIQSTKKTDLDDLERTKKDTSRIIPVAFLAAALANAGVPLLNGFSSKWLIYKETFSAHPLISILAIFTSAITLAYSLKAYTMMFKNTTYTKKLPGIEILLPVLSLLVICIIFGIFSDYGNTISETIARSLESNSQYIKVVLGK